MSEYVTMDSVLAMRPCGTYDSERLEVLAAGRDRMTLLDVLDLDIPIRDRLWVVLHVVDRRTRMILACDYAGHVLRKFEQKHPHDDRPRRCLEVCHRSLNGTAADDEMEAASYAAAAAAFSSSASASYAAYAASASSSSAADAYAASSYASAYAAASSSTDECRWQLKRTRAVLSIPADKEPKR